MIGYVTLGTNDLAKAAVFYDAIAAELGVPRMMEFDNFIAWGKEGSGALSSRRTWSPACSAASNSSCTSWEPSGSSA